MAGRKGKDTVADGHSPLSELDFVKKVTVRLSRQGELELQLVRKSIGALNDSTAVRFAISSEAFKTAKSLIQNEAMAAKGNDWTKFYQDAIKLQEDLCKGPKVAKE